MADPVGLQMGSPHQGVDRETYPLVGGDTRMTFFGALPPIQYLCSVLLLMIRRTRLRTGG